MAQYVRICLPVQGEPGLILIQEDLTCPGATKTKNHNYRACALSPGASTLLSHVPQLPSLNSLKPLLPQQKAHCHPEARNKHWQSSLLATARESSCTARKTQNSQVNRVNYLSSRAKRIFIQACLCQIVSQL